MSTLTCGHDCDCPSALHHAALTALARLDAPIPPPSLEEIRSTLQSGHEEDGHRASQA